jgi:hypothetical protein
MGMLIVILIFALMDCESEKRGQNKDTFKSLFIIASVSIFAINNKFTGFICGVVLIGYIVKQIVQKNYKNAVTLTLAGMLILAIGVLFVGYNPYITNFNDFGHPFYPLFGKNSIDIMYNANPKSLIEANPIQKFFALFLLDYNWKSIPFNPVKIPMLRSHHSCDLRLGGFGMLFMEICFFILLTFFLNLKNKNYKKLFFPVGLLLFISIIMPANWWARYIPFFWYAFIFLLVPLDIDHSRNKKLFYVLFLLIIINSGTFLIGNAVRGITYTQNLKQFIIEIKNSGKETITVMLEQEYFQYSLNEKLKHIDKNILFVPAAEDEKSSSNEVFMSHIKGWY